MQIESIKGLNDTNLRLHDGAGLDRAIGIFIAFVGLAGLIYHLGNSNIVGVIFTSAFVVLGIWLFMRARSYTVSVDSSGRQVKIEIAGMRGQDCEVVAFNRIAEIEYHDRRRVPRLGKSHLVQRIVLRLNDGSALNACNGGALIGSNKDQAAQRLAEAIGVPCVTLTDPDYE